MAQAFPSPGGERRPLSKTAVPLPYSSVLGRAAWWAWLTLDNDDLAERLAVCHTALPPWLDSRPWFLAGLLLGLLPGGLTALVVWLLSPEDPISAAAAGLWVDLAMAGMLAGRDRRGETAGHFPQRLALIGLHLAYLLPAAALGGAAIGRTGADGARVTAVLIGLVLQPFVWRATTPLLFVEDYDAVWPAIAGIASLVLRALAALATAALATVVLPLGVAIAVALAALLLLALPRWQDQLAAAWAERIGQWPAARRVGRKRALRRRFEPPAFALEAMLLARPLSPDDWSLAAAYCEARDYPPEALSEAVSRLWSGVPASLERARAAAWCALELWCSPESSAESAYRGYVRVDALANQQPLALDEPFWLDFAQRAGDRPIRAQAVELLCARESALPVAGMPAWRLVRRMRWAELLGQVGDEARRDLLGRVMGLQGRLRSPEALLECWEDIEQWAENEGRIAGETIVGQVSSRAIEVTDEVLGGVAEVPPSTHRLFGLVLRQLAWRAADDGSLVGQWYEVARRFEALPVSRQREVISSFGWLMLWRRVARAVGDREEWARQEELYQSTSRR